MHAHSFIIHFVISLKLKHYNHFIYNALTCKWGTLDVTAKETDIEVLSFVVHNSEGTWTTYLFKSYNIFFWEISDPINDECLEKEIKKRAFHLGELRYY
jgi:hypothetical protein